MHDIFPCGAEYFFNKIKIITCKPFGKLPRDGRLSGKDTIRVVNYIKPHFKGWAQISIAT